MNKVTHNIEAVPEDYNNWGSFKRSLKEGDMITKHSVEATKNSCKNEKTLKVTLQVTRKDGETENLSFFLSSKYQKTRIESLLESIPLIGGLFKTVMTPERLATRLDKKLNKILNKQSAGQNLEKKYFIETIESNIFNFKSVDLEKIKDNTSIPGFNCPEGFYQGDQSGYTYAKNEKYRVDLGSALDNAKTEVNGALKRKNDISEKDVNVLKAEYKIHLMPRLSEMGHVVEAIQEAIYNDPEFSDSVAQYKVLKDNFDENKNIKKDELILDRNGQIFPRIAIYADNKQSAQKILDKICELFPDQAKLAQGSPQEDVTPRYNVKVNELIFYAQGSADIKAELKNYQLDESDRKYKYVKDLEVASTSIKSPIDADMIHFSGLENRLKLPK
jgi:hypothetical protein